MLDKVFTPILGEVNIFTQQQWVKAFPDDLIFVEQES
jgi:hypothetical protein